MPPKPSRRPGARPIAPTPPSRAFWRPASHDLRQPLQTLSLLQGLLAKTVQGDKAQSLIARQDDTLVSMAAMLDALLDINQIEAGFIQAEKQSFPIGELLLRKRDEFDYSVTAKGLQFHVVDCALEVHSDPRLLRQIIHNLLSNALKYTEEGRILLGCRRRGAMLSVEVWDTGIGIPEGELQSIFDEYHQVDNHARERSRGLGLGLSIVQRLSTLLDHPVRVRSREGRGSMFAIEVPLAAERAAIRSPAKVAMDPVAGHPHSTILIIEDDPDLGQLLGMLIESEGYHVAVAHDGPAALTLVQDGSVAPQLLLADFNLPGRLNGLQTVGRIRQNAGRAVPAIILTGDISTETMREVAAEGCTQLNKPAKRDDLIRTIAALLSPAPETAARHPRVVLPALAPEPSTVFVVDDDPDLRAALRSVLEEDGRIVEDFADGEAFLSSHRQDRPGCLLIDAYLPGMKGLDLLRQLQAMGSRLPSIMITGRSDVAMAVQAMKAGASDFIEKPVGRDDLIASIDRALHQARDKGQQVIWREGCGAQRRVAHPEAAADHGQGGGRPAKQEHRRRSRHQPAHGGKSPRLHHAQDRGRLAPGPRATGARGGLGMRKPTYRTRRAKVDRKAAAGGDTPHAAAFRTASACCAIIASSFVASTRTSTVLAGVLMQAALARFAAGSIRRPSHSSRAHAAARMAGACSPIPAVKTRPSRPPRAVISDPASVAIR